MIKLLIQYKTWPQFHQFFFFFLLVHLEFSEDIILIKCIHYTCLRTHVQIKLHFYDVVLYVS